MQVGRASSMAPEKLPVRSAGSAFTMGSSSLAASSTVVAAMRAAGSKARQSTAEQCRAYKAGVSEW